MGDILNLTDEAFTNEIEMAKEKWARTKIYLRNQ